MIFTSPVLRSAAVAVLLLGGGALANPAAPGSMSLNPRDAGVHNPAGNAKKISLKEIKPKTNMRRLDNQKVALNKIEKEANVRRKDEEAQKAVLEAKEGASHVARDIPARTAEDISLKDAKQETNAQRLARGLPPKKPHFRRAADRTGNRKARPSSTPATASAQSAGACTPRSGVVHVTSPEAEGRPQLNGFLSMRANRFGQYGYTADKNDALEVTVNDCTGTPFDIMSSNGLADFPFVGGIKGFSSDSPDHFRRTFLC